MLPCWPSIITLPLVWGQEITTCCYKGLLRVRHLTLLGYSQYSSIAKVSHRNAPPLAPCRFQEVVTVPLRSTKSDTLPEAFLISKQAVPYQTHGGTCCPVGLTPKNRPLADSSKTNHKPWGSQPSPPYHNLAQTSASIYDQNTTIIP
jgi:hypothetical protein